eukprot:Opistho-2@37491
MVGLTSAAGIVALLDEPDDQLKVFALERLNGMVDTFWAEVSESVGRIEELYENEKFAQRQLAALVASKVYYHLGEFDDSLAFALGAGDLFDVSRRSEYVDTMVAKCIDRYIRLRTSPSSAQSASQSDGDVVMADGDGASAGGSSKDIDPRLTGIVDRMFERCLHTGSHLQAIGIALETHRIDVLERAISASDDVSGMLSYCFGLVMSLVQHRVFRNSVLRVLVRLYLNLATPDYVNVCQCLIHLDDATAVAEILRSLVKEDGDQAIMALQIAFDLYESASQKFLRDVRGLLPGGPDDKAEGASADGDGKKGFAEWMGKLHKVLSGDATIALHLEFLYSKNHTDLNILKNTKTLQQRGSVVHSAIVIANGLMHAGTTVDTFLRDNLEWLGRAINWAKFSATASLGVIHKGHVKDGMNVLAPYLPSGSGSPGSPYAEGGGLYALGLIHANHGDEVSKYLLTQLRNASTEIVQHGACLGLGVAAMASGSEEIYDELKSTLYSDSAVAGEACGLAMGLLMVGTEHPTAVEDMIAYAHETQHEKIIRGLALGIALINYGREQLADASIDALCADKDPILRAAGMYSVAMAYAGTGNNGAIRRLLHVAVSDVNDDVRRAAVTSLGFVLFRTPEQCPSVVSLLSESYNPHVRYGAAMALGISCAGTGLREAVAILEPMASDAVSFVRQGALIALAMVLVQQNDTQNPKAGAVRRLYEKVLKDKHEDSMARFGAIIGQGIIDAGGRNVTIALQSRTGHTSLQSVVGLLVFTQFWYWFPLTHFISLAFTPTAVIALNSDLKMPKLEFRSDAKPSLFAYPPPLQAQKEASKEKVAPAVLSFSARASKKASKKDDEKKEEKKDDKKEEKKDGAEPMDVDKAADEQKKKEPEPEFEMLANPARAVPQQLKHVTFASQRYVPVNKTEGLGGIVVVKNNSRDEPEELVEMTTNLKKVEAVGASTQVDEDEADPPEPFEWTD